MIRDIKTGHLYFLRNGKIICIDRMDPNEMFFEACNKKEYILLRNAKLHGKLLYLHAKEIRFLKLAEIKAPLLVEGIHVRVQEKIFDYQEALARRYNEELVEKLTEEDEIQYRYAHQKRTNHFWHRKKP